MSCYLTAAAAALKAHATHCAARPTSMCAFEGMAIAGCGLSARLTAVVLGSYEGKSIDATAMSEIDDAAAESMASLAFTVRELPYAARTAQAAHDALDALRRSLWDCGSPAPHHLSGHALATFQTYK